MNIILSLLITIIPVVKLTGTFGMEYSDAIVQVINEGDTMPQMTAKVKWRGGLTNSGDKHKRNYNIKFIDENGEKQNRSFFSLRSDNHWILNGALTDYSRIRNLVSTELWLDMSQKPYYINKEPEALTGARSRLVELYINDEYRGIYAFGETVDRKQMKLKKYKNNIFRGMLWKGMTWSNSTMMNYGIKEYNDSSYIWDGIKLMYPDIDEVCPTDWHTIYNAVNFVCTSSDEIFADSVESYFDMPLVIDYLIFLNVTFAIDNCGKNMFWGCYDQTKDRRLIPAVWDLDCTFGQTYNPADIHPVSLGPDKDYMTEWNNLYLLKRINNNTKYRQAIYNRYIELRQDVLTPDSIYNRFSLYYNMLDEAGATEREEEKWSGDEDLAGNVLDLSSERDFIKDWIYKRIDYLDTYFNAYDSSTGIKEISEQKDARLKNETIYDISGRIIKGIPYKGIYIINGKKHVK